MRGIVEQETVRLPAGGVDLEANLALPPGAQGIVIFAHGSGSSRHSPRNRFVAEHLQESGLGTLLLDLLTTAEEQVDISTRHLRFDIKLLAERLSGAAQWVRENDITAGLPVGYFGASTGAGAALVAAARAPEGIAAIVSRGGRPDLAGPYLELVKVPTRLIVGGEDRAVIELNQIAYDQMRCEKDLQIVPRATHLFEESGALERVAELAGEWFAAWLRGYSR